MDAKTVGEKAQAEGLLSGALGQLRVQVENYPDLKANQNFLALQEELTSTENKISFSRQAYNDQVLFYNNKIQMFHRPPASHRMKGQDWKNFSKLKMKKNELYQKLILQVDYLVIKISFHIFIQSCNHTTFQSLHCMWSR